MTLICTRITFLFARDWSSFFTTVTLHHAFFQHQEIGGDHLPSSSKMISFELSDGHPYGPHVPTTMDDDQYVEYQLDDLAGFPCDVEEEERVSLVCCAFKMMFIVLKLDLLPISDVHGGSD